VVVVPESFFYPDLLKSWKHTHIALCCCLIEVLHLEALKVSIEERTIGEQSTWFNTFNRSRGAVAVREVAPAIAPKSMYFWEPM
jgi:hypothetical protein